MGLGLGSVGITFAGTCIGIVDGFSFKLLLKIQRKTS